MRQLGSQTPRWCGCQESCRWSRHTGKSGAKTSIEKTHFLWTPHKEEAQLSEVEKYTLICKDSRLLLRRLVLRNQKGRHKWGFGFVGWSHFHRMYTVLMTVDKKAFCIWFFTVSHLSWLSRKKKNIIKLRQRKVNLRKQMNNNTHNSN